MTPVNKPRGADPEIRVLATSDVRKDGKTQQRVEINSETVADYAALMREGVVFPPIRVWWDGSSYWLTDGFHRLAAAEQAERTELSCEVYCGTLSDAQWDSYAANTTHGLRRTTAETQNVLALALQHAKAAALSNIQIARHLNIAETTVRRWKKRLSSTGGEDAVRIVTRSGDCYKQRTSNIGKNSHPLRKKSRKDLHCDLNIMKDTASPKARRLLNVIEKWAFGKTTAADCLGALERFLKEWKTLIVNSDGGRLEETLQEKRYT